MQDSTGRSRARTAAAAWTAALALTIALIGATHYKSPDDDSFLYAGISARLSELPVRQWIAPEWWGFWTLHGPYCEHPVGLFILPATLARLGFPAEQAAYAANALYQVLSLVLAASIAARVTGQLEARALGWLLQLLPIAFVFRVRANHEYAVLAGVLLALYSAERARTRAAWTIGMVAGFLGVLLVKGVFALVVPVVCAAWLVARADRPSAIWRPWPAWAALAAMPVAGALVTWGYEAEYAAVTGRSFLAVYQSRQLPQDAMSQGSLVPRTAYSLVWYFARVIWYAAPWSVVAGAAAVRAFRSGRLWPWSQAGATDRNETGSWQGAWFAVAASLALVTAFSLAHRKADRYIFPVYFLVSALGGVVAVRRFGALRRLTERLDRPWVPAAVYMCLFLLRLVTLGKLPEFTFWRS
jgi:4-amino-4-deoxy-L-arabinose transferase-like glycosyltransferase